MRCVNRPYLEVPYLRRYSSAVLLASVIGGWLLAPSLVTAAGCDDYLTQREAQARLRADPTDPEGLDPDNNGIACERNPQPYDTTPVVRPGVATPTATPEPEETLPIEEPAVPEEEPEALEPDGATPTPGVRSPLLGPPPPPLIYLQGGAPPPYVRSGETTATPSTLAYVQGADPSVGPAVMQRALGVIQPPNTGDGGLPK